jgi:non-ribosomal peptide synthetase component E (peptide arylation enzyme)
MEGVRPYPAEFAKEYREKGWWLGTTVISAFNRTCDILPEKEALVEDETRLTFSQLRESAQKTALAFLRLGLRKESIVLLQMPNWVEAVIIYLGLQMIGSIPVLCIPRHRRWELERFSELTQAEAWIGPVTYGNMEYVPMVKSIAEKSPHLKHLIVVRGDAPEGTIAFSRLIEDVKVDDSTTEYLSKLGPSPDDVMHLSPTGGTTGLPKLVPKTHNAHMTCGYYLSRASERDLKEVSLVIAPVNHQAAQVWNVAFMALFGGKIVLYASTKVKDVLKKMEQERVTCCFLVPAMLADIANEPDVDNYSLSPLLSVVTGAARTSAELVEAVCQKLKGPFFNTYGSTEGAGTTTRTTDPFEVVAHTVGKPMCPYDKYVIIDEEGNEVPLGQEGELAIRGPCIFAGYYKSEAENELSFTRDGFFRTGDLGKFTKEGNIVITGRKKDLIKRGGETIIPIEIEEMIAGHPKVAGVAVVGMPDPRLGERICAYIQPVPGEKISFDEVITYLKAHGASVLLLPERIEVVEELPLTAMNKVEKARLREDITQKLKAEGKI